MYTWTLLMCSIHRNKHHNIGVGGIRTLTATVHQERHAGVLTTTPAAHTTTLARLSLSILLARVGVIM